MLFEEVIEQVKRSALQFGGHIPMLLVEGTKRNTVIPLETMPADQVLKHRTLFRIGYNLANDVLLGDLVQVFFIGEAWMSRAKGGKLPKQRPSEDPQHEEVLTISYINIVEHTKGMVVFTYVRDEDGKLVELKQFKPELGEATFESPLVDAFIDGYELGKTVKHTS